MEVVPDAHERAELQLFTKVQSRQISAAPETSNQYPLGGPQAEHSESVAELQVNVPTQWSTAVQVWQTVATPGSPVFRQVPGSQVAQSESKAVVQVSVTVERQPVIAVHVEHVVAGPGLLLTYRPLLQEVHLLSEADVQSRAEVQPVTTVQD